MTKSQPGTWGVIILFSGFFFFFFSIWVRRFNTKIEEQFVARLQESHSQPLNLMLAQAFGKEGCDILALQRSQKNNEVYFKRALCYCECCCCVAPWTEQNPSVFRWGSVVRELFHCSAQVYSCGLPGSGGSINSASNLSPPLFSEY